MARKQTNNSTQKPITLLGAFGKIIPLCLLSIMIAGAIISVANDVYAFVKPQRSVVLYIQEPHDADSFAKLLQSSGVINNAFVFELYLNSHGHSDDVQSLYGEISLDSSMSYRELVNKIF